MPIDFTPLDTASRLLVEAELKVATGGGGRFQPTGFPDLGPALYKGVRAAPNGDQPPVTETVDMLLVESVQSMANRLEDVCLQGEDYNPDCLGVPYVRVLDGHNGNTFLTSSVREPHRLASPYVLAAKRDGAVYREELKTALGSNKQRPVHIWRMVPTIFDRDPGCVLHGVFLEEIDGRIRLPRLVSAYIEACSPNQANSGGVYRGEVTAKDNIPYPRQEFTSSSITASFILHLSTLKGYGLDDHKSRFLQAWALYKIDRFLHQHLRLRTACEFQVLGMKVTLDGPEGQSQDLGDGNGKWPCSPDILNAFSAARDRCFPRHNEGDEWARRRVVVVTYALDIVGKEALTEGLSAENFVLEGFTDRAEVKQLIEGKGNNRKTFQALVITGEWPEEDQQALLDKNPVKKDNNEGEEVDNPAHDVIKKALKKWNDAWKKVQKKTAGAEEAEDQE
ncbi:MAG: type I-U CRISPR-associated protein Cas7 [Planctomycetes bacterium]|nr:type I-U CRISPR-associated protein Cas7 [Planctomycetota bacterium]